MTDKKTPLLILTLTFLLLLLITTVNSTHHNHLTILGFGSGSRSECEGTIGECFEDEDELERRILAGATRYISYDALNKNRVPCSRRGASYYNCRPGAQANPYSRGCSAIAHCKRA